ncbi:MAG: superoxide dismutase family protein [Chloroflexota bacterium]|nr:superoxide dismutase family protein [Chloroflexota bacterium]
MFWRRKLLFLVALVVLVSLPVTAMAGPSGRFASAKMYDATGEFVGIAIFHQSRDGGVQIHIAVRGLTVGSHGIHIHAVGACTPDFAAAGSHFNPTNALHPNHAGDLGNITANRVGIAILSVYTRNVTLSTGLLSLLDADGSALILHAGPDDLHTDPTGNSGGRVACGVITS